MMRERSDSEDQNSPGWFIALCFVLFFGALGVILYSDPEFRAYTACRDQKHSKQYCSALAHKHTADKALENSK